MMTSYIVIYCSPVNRDYHLEMCLTTKLIIFHSLECLSVFRHVLLDIIYSVNLNLSLDIVSQ